MQAIKNTLEAISLEQGRNGVLSCTACNCNKIRPGENFFMKRDIEKTYSRKAFVARLRRLADALERGERFVTLVASRRIVVPRAAVYGIEYEREGGVEEIEFQITWKTARRRKARP